MKRYIGEEGATMVRSLPDVVLSALTRVELPSAVWRRHRLGELTATSTRVVLDAFDTELLGTDSDPPVFAAVDLDDHLLAEAQTMVARHGLRTGDAIQLASALAVRRADPGVTDFVCFDRRLRESAAREDFRLVPAER